MIPSVFTWPRVSTALTTSSQTSLLYPARRVATVWQRLISRHGGQQVSAPAGRHVGSLAAAAEVIGARRARLLDALRSPATTSTLARQFEVTPGAVSQHLAALHRARPLDRQRSGRVVL